MTETKKPPPNASNLHEAALAHLARYATTRAGLLRVLDRRIARWVREGGDEESGVAARAAARSVVERLVSSGVVNDAAFAEMRARSLTRAGRSRRVVSAHLRARGVSEAQTAESLPADPDAEFATALTYARRRRMGPYRRSEIDPALAMKELAAMARAGFTQEIARRALACDAETADDIITRSRLS